MKIFAKIMAAVGIVSLKMVGIIIEIMSNRYADIIKVLGAVKVLLTGLFLQNRLTVRFLKLN